MFNLKDLINLEIVKKVLNEYHQMTGLNFILKDYGGTNMTDMVNGQKPVMFCQKLYQYDSGHNCYLSDVEGLNRAEKEHNPVIYTCHAGLTDAVIPLYYHDQIVGAVYTGQVLLQNNAPINENRLEDTFHIPKNELRDISKTLHKIQKEHFTFYINTLYWILNYIINIELENMDMLDENNNYFTQLKIIKAEQIINKRYKEPLTMFDVAREVSISPSYFSTLFKKQLGLSFKELLNKIRVDKAKLLLKSNTKSITETGYEVGFNDSNYFSTVFKKLTGLSPRKYQKQFCHHE